MCSKQAFWKTTCFELAVALIAFAPLAQAQGERGGQLVGTWASEVTVRNCQTGAVIRSFSETKIFAPAGTVTGITGGVSPALVSTAIGTWQHVGGDNFASTAYNYRFNLDGSFAGSQKVTRAIVIVPSAGEFTSTNNLEVKNAVGAVIATGCSTEVGHRLD